MFLDGKLVKILKESFADFRNLSGETEENTKILGKNR
jgi:hypothetical protein